MKRFGSLILVLALVAALLTGCCLKHEWKEATCDAPKTCTKCDETEGEALGHKWAAATCELAETCSVCGKTNGVPNGHDLTIMEMYPDSYDGVCKTCGKSVTEPVNDGWESLAQVAVLGHWTGVWTDISTMSSVKDGVDYYVDFMDSGRARMVLGDKEMAGPWELLKAMESDDGTVSLAYTVEFTGDFNLTLPFILTTANENVAKDLRVAPGLVLSMSTGEKISLFTSEVVD